MYTFEYILYYLLSLDPQKWNYYGSLYQFIPSTKCTCTCFCVLLLLFSNLTLRLSAPTDMSFFFKTVMSSSSYCKFSSSLFSYKCLVRCSVILPTCCICYFRSKTQVYKKLTLFFLQENRTLQLFNLMAESKSLSTQSEFSTFWVFFFSPQ